MRLWIDDVRQRPDGFDVWARTYEEAVNAIEAGNVTHVSFDHDLGEEASGYDIACRIEAMASDGTLGPITWRVHSANPVGRDRIVMAMRGAERLWGLKTKRPEEATGG